MPSEVLLQATRSGVRIVLPSGQLALTAVMGELTRHLGAAPALGGAAVTLVAGGSLSDGDLTALERLLIGEHGAACLEVVRAAAVAGASRDASGAVARQPPGRALAGRPTDSVGDSLLVRRTLRSGQRVRFAGNVVVLGDVNPGAEIVAGGDIVVMGTLRGVAHAGAGGDSGAIVAALRLLPTQLRVAGVIGRSPDGSHERPDGPEVARVRDGLLVVERLQPSLGDLVSGSGGGATGAADGGQASSAFPAPKGVGP
jgi:septum site-determining protein MinC